MEKMNFADEIVIGQMIVNLIVMTFSHRRYRHTLNIYKAVREKLQIEIILNFS